MGGDDQNDAQWRLIHVGDTGARVQISGDRVRKVFRTTHQYRQALEAYRRLSTCDPPVAPVLLQSDDHARALELRRISVWDEATRTGADLSAIGRLLARVHAQSVEDTDAMPLADAFVARSRRAVQVLAAHGLGEVAVLRAHVESTDWGRCLENERRVFCHRDFRPRNWGVSSRDGMPRVFDWEHARPDAAAVDFARLSSVLSDSQLQAFLSGYASIRPLPSAESRAAAEFLHMVQTWAWGHLHREPRYNAEAEGMYERWVGQS